MLRSIVSILLLVLVGCDEPGAESERGSAGPPEAECVYECPLEADETCDGCAERIATCCYGDEVHAARVPAVMKVCEGDPACRACCDECASLSCEELIENNNCPAILEEM